MTYRPDDNSQDERWLPAVRLIERTGAQEFQIRYCEEEKPVVWMALAMHMVKKGRPVPVGTPGAKPTWSVGAGIGPTQALFALCDTLMDGGTCQHCGRPTGFVPDLEPRPELDQAVGAPFVCWYKWDPELQTFRRDCEGRHVHQEDNLHLGEWSTLRGRPDMTEGPGGG